jgi:hypothetical protein
MWSAPHTVPRSLGANSSLCPLVWPGTNAQAYCLSVTTTILTTLTSFFLRHWISLKNVAKEKHSSLLCRSVVDEEKKGLRGLSEHFAMEKIV